MTIGDKYWKREISGSFAYALIRAVGEGSRTGGLYLWGRSKKHVHRVLPRGACQGRGKPFLDTFIVRSWGTRLL